MPAPAAASRREAKSYHLHGEREGGGYRHLTTGVVDTQALLDLAHRHGVSVTAFLSAVMAQSIIGMQDMKRRKKRQRPVKITVPVDLRRLFGSRTLRNFSLVLNIGADPRFGEYTLEELCRQSDILSVHLPLNDATRGLFSRELIGLCKPSCLFINVARGAVADEAALAEALTEGRLGGLGIDVYSAEPFPEDHPFYAIREREDVCFTPHMAWGGMETRQRCIREIGENIAAFLRGERRNRVD